MILDRNENKDVAVLLGAGSMGMAILRRVAAGKKILLGGRRVSAGAGRWFRDRYRSAHRRRHHRGAEKRAEGFLRFLPFNLEQNLSTHHQT